MADARLHGWSIVAGLALTIRLTALAHGGGICVPFDADDTGCVALDAVYAQCENQTAAAVSKLLTRIIICHNRAATLGLSGKPFEEQGCENDALGKFDVATSGLVGCPACVDAPSIRDENAAALEGSARMIFCDGAVPLGDGDDEGFVPFERILARCEIAMNREVGRLVKATLACHMRAVGAVLDGRPVDEEACEGRAMANFDRAAFRTAGCPVCLSQAEGALRDGWIAFIDRTSADLYCSP